MNPFKKTVFKFVDCPGAGQAKVGGSRGTCVFCGRASVPEVDNGTRMVAAPHSYAHHKVPVRVWR